MTTTASTRGGAWLVEDVAPGAIFTVEQFSDEHRLIARTADDFMRHEVAPALERLEQKDWSLARTLVQRCGALGLIGTDVPEAYGGVDEARGSIQHGLDRKLPNRHLGELVSNRAEARDWLAELLALLRIARGLADHGTRSAAAHRGKL